MNDDIKEILYYIVGIIAMSVFSYSLISLIIPWQLMKLPLLPEPVMVITGVLSGFYLWEELREGCGR